MDDDGPAVIEQPIVDLEYSQRKGIDGSLSNSISSLRILRSNSRFSVVSNGFVDENGKMMDATSNHFDPESTSKKPMVQSIIVPGPVDV